jgi:DNA-binding response OmpR family regulator
MVLLDIHLPDASGETVLEKIRINQSLAQLPVIMISGEAQESFVVKCLKAGANDYLTKPIRIDLAVTRILNHLKFQEINQNHTALLELAAVHAMVATYNHEINNPLAIALASLAKLKNNRNNDSAFEKVEQNLNRITDIVKKIKEIIFEKEVSFENYPGNSKILKLKKGK